MVALPKCMVKLAPDAVEPAADVKPLLREVALKLDRHGDGVVICYLGLGLIAVGINKVGVRRLAFNGNYLAEIDVCSVLKGRSADLYRVGCADLSLIAEKRTLTVLVSVFAAS